jgi:hypothetical protein
MNEAQTRFNKIDPKLRDDQREDDQRVIDLFPQKLANYIIYMYLCSVFAESLNLVLCQESQENQAELASIIDQAHKVSDTLCSQYHFAL